MKNKKRIIKKANSQFNHVESIHCVLSKIFDRRKVAEIYHITYISATFQHIIFGWLKNWMKYRDTFRLVKKLDEILPIEKFFEAHDLTR